MHLPGCTGGQGGRVELGEGRERSFYRRSEGLLEATMRQCTIQPSAATCCLSAYLPKSLGQGVSPPPSKVSVHFAYCPAQPACLWSNVCVQWNGLSSRNPCTWISQIKMDQCSEYLRTRWQAVCRFYVFAVDRNHWRQIKVTSEGSPKSLSLDSKHLTGSTGSITFTIYLP